RRIELGTGTVQIDAQSTIDLNSTGLVRISNGVNIGSPSTNATAGGLSVAGAVRVENTITATNFITAPNIRANSSIHLVDQSQAPQEWAISSNNGLFNFAFN